MNAPPALVLLFGNWLGFLVALAVGGTHVVIWYQNQLTVPWWVLALGLFVMAQALRVRWRYAQYRDWRRAAEELSGAADMRRAVAARRRPVLIALASVALWFGCIWWVGTHSARDPTSEVAAVLWFGISLAWLWMGEAFRKRRAVIGFHALDGKRCCDFVALGCFPRHFVLVTDKAAINARRSIVGQADQCAAAGKVINAEPLAQCFNAFGFRFQFNKLAFHIFGRFLLLVLLHECSLLLSDGFAGRFVFAREGNRFRMGAAQAVVMWIVALNADPSHRRCASVHIGAGAAL